MMTAYVALLRAVNVGGTGKLSMADLAHMCAAEGFEHVRTYIASGNVVFRSDAAEADVRAALERRLEAHAGRAVGVLVRTAGEMAAVAAGDPFPGAPAAQVAAIFIDGALPSDPLEEARGRTDEEVRPGARVLYVRYPSGMGRSRLRLPCAARGTARNMNTVAKLAAMAGELV